ncbi:hypothetical protein AKJ09_06475 [Labilithrix luteola]|uniref:Tryptophan synthase alpha chain n=1 Tax=Labilithrix luteola TaxID=1391654 RepID=A0A0K1Q2E4_9BACT|nr:hypothetical protein AKJ09_06475 [Labilithrix luteola]
MKAFFALAAVAVPLMVACSDDTPSATTNRADAGTPPTSSPSGTATPSTCTDGVKGGTETDVDCGGACNKCVDGKACGGGVDCASGVCKDKVCAAPTCKDGVKNGKETARDCGGGCAACTDGEACSVATDCTSGTCGANHTCSPISCSDGVKNGKETDEDCGGDCATKCDASKKCVTNDDCASGVCDSATKLCSAPACNDGVKNGDETDKDCGGSCPKKCESTAACKAPSDCASGVCTGKVCQAPACNDEVKNGTETDKDCGGTCPTKCGDALACAEAGDCMSGVCTDNVCRAAP